MQVAKYFLWHLADDFYPTCEPLTLLSPVTGIFLNQLNLKMHSIKNHRVVTPKTVPTRTKRPPFNFSRFCLTLENMFDFHHPRQPKPAHILSAQPSYLSVRSYLDAYLALWTYAFFPYRRHCPTRKSVCQEDGGMRNDALFQDIHKTNLAWHIPLSLSPLILLILSSNINPNFLTWRLIIILPSNLTFPE